MNRRRTAGVGRADGQPTRIGFESVGNSCELELGRGRQRKIRHRVAELRDREVGGVASGRVELVDARNAACRELGEEARVVEQRDACERGVLTEQDIGNRLVLS